VNRFEPEMLRDISDFSSLIKFLRNHLNWPLDGEDVEDLTFDYTPEELGISEEATVKINYIKQLRPFMINQPWGIFYIDFENKKLPIVLLRRILQKLVLKKKHSANRADIPQWHLDDLLFINSYGDLENRSITFTHFKCHNLEFSRQQISSRTLCQRIRKVGISDRFRIRRMAENLVRII